MRQRNAKQVKVNAEWWSTISIMCRHEGMNVRQRGKMLARAGACWDAIFRYAFDGVPYEGKDRTVQAAFAMVKDSIDAQRASYNANGTTKQLTNLTNRTNENQQMVDEIINDWK